MGRVCWNLEGSVVQKGLCSESIPLQTEISFSSSQDLFRTTEKPNKILGRRVRAQSLSKSHLWAGVSLVHWFRLRHMVIMTRGEWLYGSFMSTLIHFLPHCCGEYIFFLFGGDPFSVFVLGNCFLWQNPIARDHQKQINISTKLDIFYSLSCLLSPGSLY